MPVENSAETVPDLMSIPSSVLKKMTSSPLFWSDDSGAGHWMLRGQIFLYGLTAVLNGRKLCCVVTCNI
jgi:hypothetical protein